MKLVNFDSLNEKKVNRPKGTASKNAQKLILPFLFFCSWLCDYFSRNFMKVLPTCGKSTVECQSFMVLDILVAIPSSSSTAEGSNHRDLNPPLIIGGPTFISPSVSLSIFRLRVKSYQVLKWTLRIHRHIYSLETVLAGRNQREIGPLLDAILW